METVNNYLHVVFMTKKPTLKQTQKDKANKRTTGKNPLKINILCVWLSA
jgi:hypothetical protein